MTFQSVVSEAIFACAAVIKMLFFVRIILSWFPQARNSRGVLGQIVGAVFAITEPILGPIRRLLQKSPLGGGGMPVDFSPILAYFVVDAVAILLGQIISAF